jgi:hypothetical protein
MLGIKTIVLSSYEYLCLTLLSLFDGKQVRINQTKEEYDQIDQRHIQRPSQQQLPTRWGNGIFMEFTIWTGATTPTAKKSPFAMK